MKNKNGFTLVELAIALMVIGLLIGGVLKGQELIENARITSTIRQLNDIETAAVIFQSTYDALPGDITNPSRIPNCTASPCNVAGNGNGQNRISDTTPDGIEITNFFPHMVKAGMMQGPTGGTLAENNAYIADYFGSLEPPHLEKFFPETAIGPILTLYINLFNPNAVEAPQFLTTLVLAAPVPSIARLDNKMDDGMTYTGRITFDEQSSCSGWDSWEEVASEWGNGICSFAVQMPHIWGSAIGELGYNG